MAAHIYNVIQVVLIKKTAEEEDDPPAQPLWKLGIVYFHPKT